MNVEPQLQQLVSEIAAIKSDNPQQIEAELTKICRAFRPDAQNRAYAETLQALATYPGIEWQALVMGSPPAVLAHVQEALAAQQAGPESSENEKEAAKAEKKPKAKKKESKPRKKRAAPPISKDEQLSLLSLNSDVTPLLNEIKEMLTHISETSGVSRQIEQKILTLEEMIQIHRQETAKEMQDLRSMVAASYSQIIRTLLSKSYQPPESL